MYLVDCQIYTSIWNDAQNIGDITLVKRLDTLIL